MVRINLDDYLQGNRYQATIGSDSLGWHDFYVRKMGAGERMELSRLVDKADKFSKKKEDDLTDKEKRQAFKLMEQYNSLLFDVFEDGVGGKKVKEILHRMPEKAIQKVINDVMADEEGS